MCHSTESPPPEAHGRQVKKIQTRSVSLMKLIKQEEEEREIISKPSANKPPLKPKDQPNQAARKSKARRRKPKYLSLRSSRLSAVTETESKVTSSTTTTTTTTAPVTTRRGHQLNLFPLHPEADHQSDDNVALLFESDGGATLHGLLTSADTATTTTTSTMSSDHDQVEESNYGYHRHRSDVDIVRTAMRGSGGDRSVEKWVCYSELVKEEVELAATAATTTSSASTCCSVGDDRKSSYQDQRLALKLDYTEVLNAWSEKGSLYVRTEDGEEPPQTVPDLLQDQLFRHLHDSNANIEDLWTVPEGGVGGGCLEKKIQREASLLRYKRKRENRLFSKRIRYEVRKINAEKRPRIKGRFVRSNERQDVGHGSY